MGSDSQYILPLQKCPRQYIGGKKKKYFSFHFFLYDLTQTVSLIASLVTFGDFAGDISLRSPFFPSL